MNKMVLNAAVFGAFLIIVAGLGFFLWQLLSVANKHGQSNSNAEVAHSQQRPSREKAGGNNAPPYVQNPTDEAIAGYTKSVAIFTFFLVLATFGLVLATIGLFFSGERNVEVASRSAEAANESAKAAKQAADVAKSTLIASQRAWIKIEEIGLGGGALAIDENGASVGVSFKITNVGNSPAINVVPHVWMIALKNGGPFAPQEQQRLCEEIRTKRFGLGFALFPNEKFPANIGIGNWSVGVNVSAVELKKALQDNKYIPLQVFGCIDYTFATDPTIHHQTRFIKDLRRKGFGFIDPVDGNIPIDQLELSDLGMGVGQYAD